MNRERRYVKSSEFLFSFVYVLDAAQGTNREAVGGQKTVKKVNISLLRRTVMFSRNSWGQGSSVVL